MNNYYLKFFGHAFFFIAGYIYFFFTGRNTIRCHQALVFFFCQTGGRFNIWITWLQKFFTSSFEIPKGEGLLGFADQVSDEQLTHLLDKGYVVKNSALSNDVCDRLLKFAMSTPAVVRPMDGENVKQSEYLAIFDEKNPVAVRYDYKASDLLANPDIQDLIADPSLLALAGSYLGVVPKIDVLSMWWHTNFHDAPDAAAAQMYHFDMERPKWLKVFIYLTDVGVDNGPHSFIEGTHRAGEIPKSFLRRGYVRLMQNEVIEYFGSDRERTFIAPRGTVIVEDTSGLHKGGVVKKSPRLILQIQFSSTLFGGLDGISSLPPSRTHNLSSMISKNSIVYKGLL